MDDSTGPERAESQTTNGPTDAHAATAVESATSSPERLRAVAEEVRGSFPRPLRGPELVLIDVDPHQLYAFWSLSPGAIDAARAAAAAHGADGPMVLRMQSAEPSEEGAAIAPTTFDVEVVGLQGDCYVDLWDDPRRYQGRIGIRCADGGLMPLTFPAQVDMPAAGPVGGAPPAQAAVQAPPPPAEAQPAEAQPAEAQPVEPITQAEEPLPAGAAAAEAPDEEPEYTGPARMFTDALPEPVRHPVPLPPTEASDFDPFALTWQGPIPATAEPAPSADSTPESFARPSQAPDTQTAVAIAGLTAGPQGHEPALPTAALPVAPVADQGPAAALAVHLEADETPPPPPPSPMVQGPPVIHPLPLPPTQAGEFDPFALTHRPPGEPSPAAPLPELRQPAHPDTRALLPVIEAPAEPAVPFPTLPATPAAGAPSPTEAAPTGRAYIPSPMVQGPPVVHPLPLPPEESSEFDPFALTGREGTPPAEPAPVATETAAADQPPAAAHAAEAPAATGGGGASAGAEGGGLPLENVLHLSSWSQGEENVELEVNAELRIYGRVKPGSALQLFGRKVPLRPDGSFSISRPLPNGALVLTSVMVDSESEPQG